MNEATPRPDVLIVDDDIGVCELMREALGREGISAELAHTGAAALAALERHGPVLTLLDLKLPDADGGQIARDLSRRTPRVPFIIISGLSDTQMAIDLMREGAADFIVKDMSFLKLIPGVVKRALASQEREQKLREAEAALRESEERFRQMAQNIRDVFFILNEQRELLYISPAYEQIWGRPLESVTGMRKDWLDTVVEEDRDALRELTLPLFEGARMVQGEYRIRRPDGSMRWVQTRIYPVTDEHGRVYRAAGVVIDITERRQLEQEILNISEREQRRIGHDLHDDLCQRLAATKLRCEMLATKLQRGEAADPALAAQVSSHIAEATTLARSIARGLSPVDLEGEGLMAALAKLARTSETLHEVPVFFDCPSPVMVANTTTAAHLFRIAQELVTNAARHAQPSRIEIRLIQESDRVILSVANDGKPFRGTPASGGMGLNILRYRAGAIGATIQFQPRSTQPGGTTALCLVPLASCQSTESITP